MAAALDGPERFWGASRRREHISGPDSVSVLGPSRPDTHPQSPERRTREARARAALTQTHLHIDTGSGSNGERTHGRSSQGPWAGVHILSLPAHMYRGWPAAAVARPFPMHSPARCPDAPLRPSHLHLLRGAPPAHSPLARARARSPTSCKSHSNGLQGWASGFGNSTIGMVRVTASDSETLSTDY